MKYCTSFYQPESIRNKVDEIRFTAQNLTIALDYAIQHINKRIIVEITSLNAANLPTIEKLYKIQEKTSNLILDFYDLQDLIQYSKRTKSTNIMYHYPVISWAMIQILLYYHVSDIYIGEPIVFDLPAVKSYIKNHNVNIRVCPHKVKTELTKNIESDLGIHHFFILPQDANWYEEYIDVFELIDHNIVREEALVNAYTSPEPYQYNLNYIIENLNVELPAGVIDERWRQRRLQCHQKCLKDIKECNFCAQHLKIFETIIKKKESE